MSNLLSYYSTVALQSYYIIPMNCLTRSRYFIAVIWCVQITLQTGSQD